MPRLRMKDTPSDIEAILAKETRARKRRRKDEARTRQSDSMTPPRHPPPFPSDGDTDESALAPGGPAAPPAAAFDEAAFADRLADASAQDRGVGFFEDAMFEREVGRQAAAFAYGGAAGVALGAGGAGAVVGGMDEEEYAEYVRAGMWRRKNKDEAERMEAIEREKRRKAEKEEVENDKRRKEEAARIRKLEEKAKRRNKAEEGDARLRYDQAWSALLAPSTTPAPPPDVPIGPTLNPSTASQPPGPRPLRFSDFAWPLYPPMAFPPLSWPAPTDITPSALSAFLLGHLPSDKRKATLRAAVLAYHPDRFERLVLRVPEEAGELRDRVRELGLAVSQALNDLMKAGGGMD